jgi:glucans biosynthesis protein
MGDGEQRLVHRSLFMLLLLVTAAGFPRSEARADFGIDQVAARAQRLARQPFQAPTGQVPEWLLKLKYDQWRDIRFRPERALWRDRGAPFEVQFFHLGLFYDHPVAVNVVDDEGVRPLEFSASYFDYGRNDFANKIPDNLGFAGLRIHAPFKTPSYYDEVIVFLGASYFRGVGRQHVYGMSARGAAIDTLEPSGEEFPYFKEFWLVTPLPNAKELTVYALLDSPSLTGAYCFVIQPGDQTIVRADVRLFLRRPVHKLGIAPLTSMFFHGENTTRTFADFRPEVHDSDGLLLHLATGEWLWRPLDNPRRVSISSFQMINPRGFGLMQRDRDFEHYQDLETNAEKRPSVWITPNGDWGAGHVELIELPTVSEFDDNVVAFWVPEPAPTPEAPVSLSYSMSWCDDEPGVGARGRVVATRRDHGMLREHKAPREDLHRFVVDFASDELAAAAEGTVRGVVTVAGGDAAGKLIDQHVVKNPNIGAWRLTFQVRVKSREPVELRAYLDRMGDVLTETWSYVILTE